MFCFAFLVDAALAELDSIPDVGCEAGEVGAEAEVEDEDEDDEEWSYYKMEPQQQTEVSARTFVCAE